MIGPRLLLLAMVLLDQLQVVLLQGVSVLVLLAVLVGEGLALNASLTNVFLDSHNVQGISQQV